MKLSELYSYAKSELRNHNIESYSIDALLILCHYFKVTKEEIIFDDIKEISETDFAIINNLISRRKNHEPISHIINNREFYGYDFYVDQNVLDPRADSEILVELLIKKASQKNTDLKTLELGVGTGCLTISMLNNLDNIESIGVDISQNALEICQRNITTYNLNDRFKIFQSNLFDKINEKFDIIISNPPYIRKEEIENLDIDVKNYEPRLALDGGETGLDFYSEIARKSSNFLNDDGFIILEIGFDQKNEVVEIFKQHNFKLTDFKKDLANRDRVLCFEMFSDQN